MPAIAFDDLLDEQLASVERAVTSQGWNAGPAGAGAAYGFFFATSPDRMELPAAAARNPLRATFGTAFTSSYLDEVVAARNVRRPEHETCAPSLEEQTLARSARALSAREREAMAMMKLLGAPLTPAFTEDELRRAFRTLALAYHPDRHAAGGAQEQARLGELFTLARDAYETLAGVFSRVH
jgi:hypothetical protein